jgi:low affinity Fe/Cu permease
MGLPLQLVLEYVGRSAAFLGVMAGFAVVAASALTLARRRPWRSAWPGPVTAALLGALLAASLVARFDLPEAFTFRVWCRAVPLVWSAGGALLGASSTWAWSWARNRRRPAPPAAPPSGDAPDAG